ncbi:MAG: ATP12 family protein [Pseudomonadota bacterium]
MSEWAAKRFWTSATFERTSSGFAIKLDDKPVRTPAKSPLVVPSQALAQSITAEWQSQGEVIDPMSMPFTRSANAAIDKVAPQLEDVRALILSYGETDLLCYRADGPDSLIQRQAETWDPLLVWAHERYGVELQKTAGVMPVLQPQASLDQLRAEIETLTVFQLTGFYDLVSLSGSLIIGFAAIERVQTIDQLWQASRIDEAWQQEQWGRDEEAVAMSEKKGADFFHAQDFQHQSV